MRRGTRVSADVFGRLVRLMLLWLAFVLPTALAGRSASAQSPDLVDRPISSVSVVGLSRLDETEVRNNLRVAPGQPYDPEAVRGDVSNLYRLGQFRTVTVDATLQPDGTVALRYIVTEQALIGEVQTVGNKVISDQELRSVIPLFRNAPRDDFLIERSIRNIKDLYQEKGHYLADVEVDESRLADSGILIFKIVEGPRVKVKAILFEGNDSFPANELKAQVRTKTAFFIFSRGQLDQDRLLDDVASLDRFYKDRGFVDVRVDRRIELSPDNKEAKVTYVIAEGRQYRIRDIAIEGFSPSGTRPLAVLSPEQVMALLAIRTGDVYQRDMLDRSLASIRDTYLVMGYVDVQVQETSIRVGEQPEVDLIISIREGGRSRAGLVLIQGNYITKDKVIRREVRIQPGRTIDGRELQRSKDRLIGTQLFGQDVRVTLQQPGAEDEEARDVLVEVKEKNTGSVNFGAAFGSDSGVIGEVSLNQRNFDIADYPKSFNELISGRAFRGAGQRFSLVVAPGNDVSTYSISLADPRLLESDIGGSVAGFIRSRNYDQYTEDQINGSMSLSRRLGDIWSGSTSFIWRRVELKDIDEFAPVEVYDDAGPLNLDTVGLTLTRNTVDRLFRPSRGTNLELGVGLTGLINGDRSYTTLRANWTGFLTLDEDFLGRRSVLRLNAQLAYIIGNDAPVYDKFYLGGRSFRGFDFRTISPKGVDRFGQQTTDPIGGNWLVFLGAQYEFPIFQQLLSGVFFVDSGTVTEDPGFDQYRVSVGAGLRIYVPAFGPAPIALDFGFPVVKQDLDQEQLFSFSAEVPF
ncbi:MAG: outer membrane protein assembly factor BamA [Phycisphaerales bacterium]|nr:outer membrane protein assembly factor BamA [Phycisphaerales bacterium]